MKCERVETYAKKLMEKEKSNERAEVLEIGEFYTFTKRKKRNLHNSTCKKR